MVEPARGIGTGEGSASAPLFELSGVGYAVPGRAILTDLSLRIERQAITGLIGPNGSGKSTLVKLLARQERATAGHIDFLGSDIDALGARAFARQVAYLPQFMPASDGMNVAEFVALGRFSWHGTFGRFLDRDRERVELALEQTGLSGMRERVVDTMSGGERQRVWLAMLLAQDAECLILDEPTSALDISHQAEMLHLVRDLADRRGLSVVIVMHDINMAARVCDRLVGLGTGRVVADGTPAEILTPERLDAIYGIAMGIFHHPVSGVPVGYVL